MTQNDDDGLDGAFQRFRQEIREQMAKKTEGVKESLNSQISQLQDENAKTVASGKTADEKVLLSHTKQVSELRKKVKQYCQEHDAITIKEQENTALLCSKEKELVTSKELVTKMKQRMEKTRKNEEVLSASISAQMIKISVVEVEIETVRTRNKDMLEENKKLKDKIGRRSRECDEENAEMQSYKPKMMDMIEKMVTDYRKINHQIDELDEKQKRILLEKTQIIEEMQTASESKKRKLDQVAATTSTSTAQIAV